MKAKTQFAAALLMSASFSSIAAGQNALPADPSAEPASGAENAAPDIVITATKRATTTREVPATVAVLSNEMLQRAGVKDLFQAAVLLPGTTFSRAPDDGLQLTIRGLGTPARTQSFDQSVALFLDGAFLGKGRLYSTPFFDVDRIEVIKGTQSTLLGKNTSLGAISIVSKQPGDRVEGYVTGGAEIEYGGWFTEAAVTLPASETLSFRLAGRYGDADGWVKNLTTGNDVPNDRDIGARATMRWEPSKTFDLTASYQYSDGRRIGNGYQFVDPLGLLPTALGEGKLDGTKASFVSQGEDGESVHRTKSHIANLTTNTDLGGHVLTTVSSYASYKIDFVDDFDFSDKDATYFTRTENYHQFSQEVRLTSPANQPLSYIIGGFYFDSNWKSSETQIYNTPLFIPPLGGNIFQGGFTNDFRQTTRTWSGFASTTWRFAPGARLNLGLRYASETKHGSWTRTAIAPLTPWNLILNPPFARTPLRFSDEFLNGNASLQYDLSPTLTVYAGFGRGSKTGGFAESAAVVTGNPNLPSDAGGSRVKSEEANSLEVGLKGALADRLVTFEIAAFSTKVKDFQETSFTGASFDTANVDVRSQGFDGNARVRVAQGLKLDLAATYADAEVRKPVVRPVAGAPKWTAHVGVNYEREITGTGMSIFTDAYYRYRSSMVHQRVASFRSEPWHTVDLTMGVRGAGDQWELRAAVRNLFNDVSADFSAPPADPTLHPSIRIESPSPLRTIRIEATYRF
ncbi:MAG TPA: TonB-dependent receptor [Sphingomonas sp.]|nr:TonB-dependent receptor [Sphingomonas sp.]